MGGDGCGEEMRRDKDRRRRGGRGENRWKRKRRRIWRKAMGNREGVRRVMWGDAFLAEKGMGCGYGKK